MTSDQLTPVLIGKRLPLDEIPVIDLAPFLGGTPEDRREVAQQIGQACRHIGFFYLVNHGVPHALIDETFAQAKRFFDLPAERKQEISIERSPIHRGYFSLGGENLDPAKQKDAGDFKEGIKIGRDLPLDHPLVVAGTPLHGPNQWPANLPGWRAAMETTYATLSNLGSKLMGGFALALELPEDFFADKLTEPMATLGPLHYPPHEGPISERRLVHFRGAGHRSKVVGTREQLAFADAVVLSLRELTGSFDAATFAAGALARCIRRTHLAGCRPVSAILIVVASPTGSLVAPLRGA